MKREFEELYRSKLTTAEEAVKIVKSGDRVYGGTASSGAYALLEALWNRRHELENVTMMGSNNYQYTPIYDESVDNPFLFNTYFMGINERKRLKAGFPVSYNSVHLSKVDLWVRDIGKPDVCFFEVSKPDEDGYMNYGPSGTALHKYLQEATKYISTQIAKHVLREIQDADTIQLGLGNISIAIGYGLKEFNDLGVYTELLAQPMYELMESGNVTNKYKGFMDGKTVFSFSFGSPDLYKALDHNPDYYVAPFPFVNDPRNIAKNRHMISINSTMSFNLFGEAAADCIGWKQQSGTGGQGDFVRGAQWSEGGKSIIATSSSFMKNGKRISKIVPYFAPGTAVTTPRSDIHYVATEFGCIDVRALTMQDRARAMISLAHPDFREELTSQAKAVGLI